LINPIPNSSQFYEFHIKTVHQENHFSFSSQTHPTEAQFGYFDTSLTGASFRINYIQSVFPSISNTYTLLSSTWQPTLPIWNFYDSTIRSQYNWISQVYKNTTDNLINGYINAAFPLLLQVATAVTPSAVGSSLSDKLNMSCTNIQSFCGNLSAIAANITTNIEFATNLTSSLATLNSTVIDLCSNMTTAIANAQAKTVNTTIYNQIISLQGTATNQFKGILASVQNFTTNIYQKYSIYTFIYGSLSNTITNSSTPVTLAATSSLNYFSAITGFYKLIRTVMVNLQDSYINWSNRTFQTNQELWANWSAPDSLYAQQNMTITNLTQSIDQLVLNISNTNADMWNQTYTFYNSTMTAMLNDSVNVSNFLSLINLHLCDVIFFCRLPDHFSKL
jgi:hypothetical protein